MDTIVTIINALNIDKTSLIQFGMLFFFFNLLAPLFFNRLQEVLELRESKTTKLENSAHAVYKQAEELAEQYKARVEKTHQDSQHHSNKKKSEILSREKDILKEAEDKLNAEYEQRKIKLVSEMGEKRNLVMKEAEGLSTNLVDKLTK